MSRKIDALAQAIVDDLFTNGFDEHASTLMLLDSDGKDLGGWSAEAAWARIVKLLESVGVEIPQ